jgi:hypothetical protein
LLAKKSRPSPMNSMVPVSESFTGTPKFTTQAPVL